MADVSIREQIARVRAAQPSDGSRVELTKPHATLGDLEKVVTCGGCGKHIAVPVCVDADGFVGVVCGCLVVEEFDLGADLSGRAGTGEKEDTNGR